MPRARTFYSVGLCLSSEAICLFMLDHTYLKKTTTTKNNEKPTLKALKRLLIIAKHEVKFSKKSNTFAMFGETSCIQKLRLNYFNEYLHV